jgi:hypothetical protein
MRTRIQSTMRRSVPQTRHRSGMALLLVVVFGSLLVGALLAINTLMPATSNVARARRQIQQADAANITALGYVLEDWWTVAWRSLAVNGSATTNYTVGTYAVAVTITRETITTYRVDLTATGRATAVRSERLTRRFVTTTYTPPIISLGAVNLQSGGTIVGSDDATCPTPRLTDQPGALLRTNTLTDGGGTFTGTGSGLVAIDGTLNSTAMQTLGDWRLADLLLQGNLDYAVGTTLTAADLTSSASLTSGSCAIGWGSPLATAGGCESFYPIEYARGTLQLNGGAGQGILIADGTVTMQAGTKFYGLVIIRSGGLTLTGAGTQIRGRVLMLDPAGTLTIGSGTTVALSSCAAANVNNGLGISIPIARAGIIDHLGMVEVR